MYLAGVKVGYQHNELQRACLHEHLLHDCFRELA